MGIAARSRMLGIGLLAFVLVTVACTSSNTANLTEFVRQVMEVEVARDRLVKLTTDNRCLPPVLSWSPGSGRALIARPSGEGLVAMRLRVLSVEAPQEMTATKDLLLEAYALEIAAARNPGDPQGQGTPTNFFPCVNYTNVDKYLNTDSAPMRRILGQSDWVLGQDLRARAYRDMTRVLTEAGVDLDLFPRLQR